MPPFFYMFNPPVKFFILVGALSVFLSGMSSVALCGYRYVALGGTNISLQVTPPAGGWIENQLLEVRVRVGVIDGGRFFDSAPSRSLIGQGLTLKAGLWMRMNPTEQCAWGSPVLFVRSSGCGHGSSPISVRQTSNVEYTFSNVNLPMAGSWRLRFGFVDSNRTFPNNAYVPDEGGMDITAVPSINRDAGTK